VSRIESAESSKGNVQEGQILMIIELARYNKIRKTLIENSTRGSWGHICNWNRGWRASVTTVAVCMGKKEAGMWTGHRGAYSSELGMRAGMHCIVDPLHSDDDVTQYMQHKLL